MVAATAAKAAKAVKTLAVLVATLAVVAPGHGVRAHGYLEHPAARNVVHNSDYCPHCLNAGGARETAERGWGLCGDRAAGARDHEAFGKYGPDGRVRASWRAGDVVVVRVRLTTNHLGKMRFYLCPLPGDGSLGTERRVLSERCFRDHALRVVGGSRRNRLVVVTGGVYEFAVRLRLPRGLTCRRCVLRWFYRTGNSCTPAGVPAELANPHLDRCKQYPDTPPAEVFLNCADVRISP